MILVTGGTGFFGRHLVRQLAGEGHAVRVLSRQPRHDPSPAVAWVQGDLADERSLQPALHGVHTVVHAAAIVRDGADPALEAINAEGTAAIARGARAAGVQRFVHVSSAGVYGDGATARPHAESDTLHPRTPYERSKLAAEQAMVRALGGSDVAWTILRPQGLYGADRPATADFIRQVATRRVWLHPPARVVVHPTHVRDLVQATCAVLQHPGVAGETLNVAGERALEFRELVALVGGLLGRAPLQLSAPGWTAALGAIARAALQAAGRPSPRLDRWSRRWINRAVDTAKARRLLGFAPVGLERGFAEAVAQARKRPGE